MSLFLPKRLVVYLLCLLPMAGVAFAKYENNNEETLRLVKAVYKDPDPEQLERLGDIYAQGEGVEKDVTEAITWYCYAMKKGSKTAADKLWNLENGLRAKPIKRLNANKKYNEKITLELCRYLYVTKASPNSLLDKSLIPNGIKTQPSPVPNMVYPPEYNPAIVRKFLAKGADPNADLSVKDPQNPTSSGTDIRFAVIKQKDYKTFDYMIACGACVNMFNNALLACGLYDMNVLDNKKSTDKTMKYLLARGGSLKNKGSWGENLFMSCTASVDNAQGVNFLVSQGMDPNETIEPRYLPLCKIRNGLEGLSVMCMAVSNRNVRALDALIKGGADINTIYNGKSMLDMSQEHGKIGQKEKTYEKEFERLTKATKNHHRCDESMAGLLQLAGAKKTSELAGEGGKE